MYATGNKKMLNMLILELLQECSDENHRLTQQEIIKLLDQNYGMECDRRSVKSNILSLKEMGYDISMENGCYLVEREFEEAELRLLIDSVLFSKNITSRQAKILIGKLRAQANKYFDVKVSHVANLPELFHADNKQVMYALNDINDAISQKNKISFDYNDYGPDFKLHHKREEKYIVNPYQMVANNGRYYLIGNYDKYDDISHYRIDRMTDVEILPEKAKRISQIKGMENGFSLPKHMAEHIYMFSGESVQIKLLAKKSQMNELIDWFGKDFTILGEKEEEYLITLRCNERAMYYWALQYGPFVEILEPLQLRTEIQEAINEMQKKYGKVN